MWDEVSAKFKSKGAKSKKLARLAAGKTISRSGALKTSQQIIVQRGSFRMLCIDADANRRGCFSEPWLLLYLNFH